MISPISPPTFTKEDHQESLLWPEKFISLILFVFDDWVEARVVPAESVTDDLLINQTESTVTAVDSSKDDERPQSAYGGFTNEKV